MSIGERSPARDGPQRDAWLAHALQHAPDAGAMPPSTLSDSILRQARAATREASPGATSGMPRNAFVAALAGALDAAWTWLARPPVAAGFASVMVATIVGVMWWDRPLDEAVKTRPADVARQAPPMAATAIAPESDRTVAAPPPAQKPATADAAAPARQEPAARGAAPMPKAARPAPSIAAQTTPATAPAPAATESLSTAKRSRAFASPRVSPLDDMLASIVRDRAPWTWQRSAGQQPMTQGLADWLRQLQTASTASPSRPSADAPPTDRPLLIYRDGALFATVIVDAEAAWFASPSQPTTRTALAPAAAASLQRSLDLAAP